MTIAHVFTTLLASNFFCCCFCRSAFTGGRSLSNAFTWRILERKGKRDCKGFAFISDFSCQPREPHSFPRGVTMDHHWQRDCSYRLPSRKYLPFPSAREVEITGRTFLLEQTWLQDTSTDRNGHWVAWLNTGLQIKASYILVVAWSKMNVNEFIRRWQFKRSQESRCWVGGNAGIRGVQKEDKGTKQEYGWLQTGQIWAGELPN